jgi:hypothetical protein
MMKLFAALLLLMPAASHAQSIPLEAQLPSWAAPRWESIAKASALKLSGRINPFLLRGDFDGDGRHDLALLVEHLQSRKIGIVILLRNGAAPHVLGAGQSFGNGGDNFDWLDIWNVQDKGTIQKDSNAKSTQPGADSLLLVKESSASALIYLAKGKFQWRQQGD